LSAAEVGGRPVTFLVQVNAERFIVSDEAIGSLEASILAAVAAGGAFVDTQSMKERGDLRLLVTPASRVSVERLHAQEETAPDEGEDGYVDLAYLDFDQDL
jgi:hypothetical protein